jgi:hypothetical protein
VLMLAGDLLGAAHLHGQLAAPRQLREFFFPRHSASRVVVSDGEQPPQD